VFASEAEALAAAEKAYAEYLRVSDEISAGGGADANRLKSVAVGNLVQDDLNGYQTFKAKSWHTVGSSKIAAFKAEFVDRNATQSTRAALVAYVCEDISQVDVIDASGVSVVSSTRPNVQGFEVNFDLVDSSLFPSDREPWTGSNFCV
jgi:hypothetical protein